jgi:hypothetical protein
MGEFGINKALIVQNIILGKQIGRFGSDSVTKEKDAAPIKGNESSESVYSASYGSFTIAAGNKEKEGINISVLSFVDENADESTKLELASALNTPTDILNELSYDPSPSVRIAVASNSVTPIELLMEMSIDTDPGVRAAIVKNPRTPKTILTEMKFDSSSLVKIALAVNKNNMNDILRFPVPG